MKILLINGSPHEQGCTFRALSEVQKALHEDGLETHMINIGNQAIRGCIACGKCMKTGLCIFKDDVVNECVELMQKCDGLVVGSPVYFAAPNASIIALLDRMFYRKSAPFAFKPAAAVVSCRRGGSSASLDCLNKYFSIAQMPIVSSMYWNMVHGNTPAEVEQDLEGLQTMRTLGHNMAWLAKCIATANVDLPKREDKIYTNFAR